MIFTPLKLPSKLFGVFFRILRKQAFSHFQLNNETCVDSSDRTVRRNDQIFKLFHYIAHIFGYQTKLEELTQTECRLSAKWMHADNYICDF